MAKKEKKNLKSFVIHLTSAQHKHRLTRAAMDYKHLENMLFILQKNAYLAKQTALFKLLKNKVTMKAVMMGNKGQEKTQKDIAYVNAVLKDDSIFQSMLKHCQLKLNDKNSSMIVARAGGNWATFETQIDEYFKDKDAFAAKYKSEEPPQYPKPRKLAKVTSTSVPLESDKWSLIKRKTKSRKGKSPRVKEFLGLTLGRKQIKIPLMHKGIIDRIGIKNINNATLSLKNNEIYICFAYVVEKDEPSCSNIDFRNDYNNPELKAAGIDVGLNNLLSIFVDDKSTQSLIYCGRKIKSRNTKFNRFNAKLNESISKEATEFKTTKKGIEYAVQWSQRGYELKRLKTYLIERRNRYFDNEFGCGSFRSTKMMKRSLIINVMGILFCTKGAIS